MIHRPLTPARWLVSSGAGATIDVLCLFRFFAANGTPAIFFARHLRFLIGGEPKTLVSVGLHRFTRNPVYVRVLLVVFGQALALGSPRSR